MESFITKKKNPNNKTIFCEKCGVCIHSNCLESISKTKDIPKVWYCDINNCNIHMKKAHELYNDHMITRNKIIKQYNLTRYKSNTSINLSNNVKKLYTLLNKTDKLASTGNGGAMMGELTSKSFQKILNYLKLSGNLNHNSCFIDIGSGFGKPNLHCMIDTNVKYSIGIELCEYPYKMSNVNLYHCVHHHLIGINNTNVNVLFIHANITNFQHFNLCTHLYSFDIGFDIKDLHLLAKIINYTSSLQYFISFHKPKYIIYDLGIHVYLQHIISCKMSHSGETYSCYIYKKIKSFNKLLHGLEDPIDQAVELFDPEQPVDRPLDPEQAVELFDLSFEPEKDNLHQKKYVLKDYIKLMNKNGSLQWLKNHNHFNHFNNERKLRHNQISKKKK